MKADDRIRIQHMVDASKEVLSFITDSNEKSFSQNRMIILSVIKDF